MRRDIHERACDNCGNVKQQSEKMVGGSPFDGWLRLERHNACSALSELQKDHGPWDFCCVSCVISFLKSF